MKLQPKVDPSATYLLKERLMENTKRTVEEDSRGPADLNVSPKELEEFVYNTLEIE